MMILNSKVILVYSYIHCTTLRVPLYDMIIDDMIMMIMHSIVAARNKWELKLEGGVGATYSWYFKTVAHDISFSVEFEPKGAPV